MYINTNLYLVVVYLCRSVPQKSSTLFLLCFSPQKCILKIEKISLSYSKKLASQNAPLVKRRIFDLFFQPTQARKEKRARTTKEKNKNKKKDFCMLAALHKQKKKRERDEEAREDSQKKCSSSSAGGLFFNTKNDEKHDEFQDERQVLQFLPRSSFWVVVVVVRTSTTKTRFCERMSGNTRDNIASSSKFQSSREDDRRW